jgi:hypothetical protein
MEVAMEVRAVHETEIQKQRWDASARVSPQTITSIHFR